jgi:hypothetical protein
MKRLIQSLMVCVLTLIGQGMASAPVESEVSYRYLIVLENSARMERQQEVALDTVHQLILNGIQGRIREGEVLGIWTFRDRLERHSFQPILWSPGRARDVANDVYRSLRDTGFASEPDLDLALSGVKTAAQATDRVTVFLVVSGSKRFHGTSFDTELNQVFEQHAQAMRKNRRPFVVALVMEQGRAVSHSTSPGGRLIHIPSVPEIPAPAPSGPEPMAQAPPAPLPVDDVQPTPILSADAPVAEQLSTEPMEVDAAPKPRILTVAEIERKLRMAEEDRIRRQAEAATPHTPPPVDPDPSATTIDLINKEPTPQAQVDTIVHPATPEPRQHSLPSRAIEEIPVAPLPMTNVESTVEVEARVEAAPAIIMTETGTPRWQYLLAGFGLLLLAGILSAYMYQRSLLLRARPSAISRSMDRY